MLFVNKSMKFFLVLCKIYFFDLFFIQDKYGIEFVQKVVGWFEWFNDGIICIQFCGFGSQVIKGRG